MTAYELAEQLLIKGVGTITDYRGHMWSFRLQNGIMLLYNNTLDMIGQFRAQRNKDIVRRTIVRACAFLELEDLAYDLGITQDETLFV